MNPAPKSLAILQEEHAEMVGIRRGWMGVGAVLAVGVLAGGCSGTSSPRDAGQPTSSESPGSQSPPLPGTAAADLAADQGVAAALAEEFASDDYAGLRSVIVLAGGRTVFERYYDAAATDHHRIWSVTKSVVSTLVGIAIGEGVIPGVTATLGELLPDHAAAMTPEVAGTTLEQLLTMTGGFHDDDPPGDGSDWVTAILGRQLFSPGELFSYTEGSAHLAVAVLAEATGMSVLDYARARLFDPLGIPTTPASQSTWDGTDWDPATDPSQFGWTVVPDGTHAGGIGLRLRAQDMAKIGQLYLHHGRWQGQEIVPTDWVQAATTPHVPPDRVAEWDDTGVFGDVGYGYMWWTGQVDGAQMYWANGIGGQKILVLPDRDVIAVFQVEFDAAGRRELVEAVEARLEDAFTSLIAPAYQH